MCCVEVRQGKVEVKGKAKLRFGEGGETMVRTLYTNSIPYTHSYKLTNWKKEIQLLSILKGNSLINSNFVFIEN